MQLCSPRRAFATALFAFVSLAATSAPSPATAFDLGFNDYDLSKAASVDTPANAAALATGLQHVREAGATTWRFSISWAETAGNTPPPTLEATADPAWPSYRWARTDRLVRAVANAGLSPLLWMAWAPTWAEGPSRPAVSPATPAGSWNPDAKALEAFSTALARRYDGTYPDPLQPGKALPRIATFQAWNEPNLYTALMPQRRKKGKKWTIASATIYRNLLNAVTRGVKRSQPTATVITAGTGPFGGLKDNDPRVPPAAFWRELLCVKQSGNELVGTKKCKKSRFDGWAHHTYPIGPPTRKARNIDDVVVPDMAKLTRIMTAATRARTITRKAAANAWMTEMSWDSSPDPDGLSLADQALYMEGAFYTLWKAGVRHVIWWNSRDDAEGAGWSSTLQSGIFFRGADPSQDQPKPSYTAFRFPFTAYRFRGVASLWAKPPGNSPVTIQVKRGGDWVNAATLTRRSDGVFTGRLRIGPQAEVRAVQGAETSLTWTTF